MAALRRFADSRCDIPPELLQGMDWEALLQAAVAQRVAAPLALGLKNSAAWLPEPVGARLRQHALSAARDNAIKLREFETVCRLLEPEGLPLIPIKGVALTCTVYADRPVRPMTDIDLLIRQEDLARARSRLLEAGAIPCLGANRWQDSIVSLGRQSFCYEGINLDLHWLLRFRIASRFVELDCSRAWARACPALGADVYLLSPEDCAAVLLLHASMDLGRRASFLGQLLDLALAIQHSALDQKDILRRINFPDSEPRRFVEQLLDLVYALWIEGCNPDQLPEKNAELWRQLIERQEVAEEALGLVDLKTIPSWRHRLLFLAGYLFPDPEYVQRNFGEGARSQLRGYAQHWRRLASKGFRMLASR